MYGGWTLELSSGGRRPASWRVAYEKRFLLRKSETGVCWGRNKEQIRPCAIDERETAPFSYNHNSAAAHIIIYSGVDGDGLLVVLTDSPSL